ncbi:uncharacterized protein N7443_000970, partial [Penicillium atrosanguineum]|uniref:uncharacterized protein n=1 Tax=Penicillium atrosanguineum TaxID=1132637 RepID=UPI002396F5FF
MRPSKQAFDMIPSDAQANQGHHSNSLRDVLETSDPLFNICWSRQSCSSCLAGDVACSWCAIVCNAIHTSQSAHLLVEFWWNLALFPVSSTFFLFRALHSPLTLFRIPDPLHSNGVSILPLPTSRDRHIIALMPSSTCVPNTARLPILAPLRSTHICPLGAKERWELRALPFGCSVSTTTLLSTAVAALSTVALIGVVYLVIGIVQRARSRWKEAEHGRLDDQERESS